MANFRSLLFLPLAVFAAAGEARPPVLDELADRKTSIEEHVEMLRSSPVVTEYTTLYKRCYDAGSPHLKILAREGETVEFEDQSPSAPTLLRNGEPAFLTMYGRLIEDEEGNDTIVTENRTRMRLTQLEEDFLLEEWSERRTDGAEYLSSVLGSREGIRKHQTFLGGPDGKRRLAHERTGDRAPRLIQRARFDPHNWAAGIANVYGWDPDETPHSAFLHERDGGYQLEKRDGPVSLWAEVTDDLSVILRSLRGAGSETGTEYTGRQEFMGLLFPERAEVKARGHGFQHLIVAKDIQLSLADPLEFEERLKEFFED